MRVRQMRDCVGCGRTIMEGEGYGEHGEYCKSCWFDDTFDDDEDEDEETQC